MNSIVKKITLFGILLWLLTSGAEAQNRRVIDSLMKRIPSAKDTTLAKLYNAMAWEYRWFDLDSSLKYGRLGYAVALERRFKDGLAQNQNYMGVIYSNRGDYSRAMEFFFNALQYAEQPPRNAVEVGYALNNIGNVHKHQGALAQAIEYGTRALQEFEKLGDKRGIAYCCIRLGETYEQQRNYEKALEYCYRTLKLREELQDNDGIQSIKIRLGIIYSALGDYEKALSFHRSVLDMLKASNSRWGTATSLNSIAQIYLKYGRLDTALVTAEACFKVARDFSSKEKLMEASRTLGEIYAAKQDYVRAYAYSKLAESMKDSVINEQNLRAVANMQALHDVQRRQVQIEMLQKENEKEALIRNSLIGGVLLLIIVAALAVNSYRQKKRSEEQYKVQNEELIRLNKLLNAERYKAEQQRALAEEANAFKTELLGIAAHDLKNPLQSIMGFTALILEEIDGESPVAEKLKIILRASERTLKIITDMLQTTALESRKIELKKQKTLIAELVQRVVEANSVQAELKSQKLELIITSPDAVADIDLGWMREAFENLVSNAIKYTPKGKHIRVTVSETETTVRTEVKDEGQGLTDDDMKKLFGKFQKLSARPTGGETSTGLGLSIVKQLVDLHGGKVWAESDGKDKGSTFIVELPKAFIGAAPSRQLAAQS